MTRQRISTAINTHIIPLLLEHSGKVWSAEFARSLQQQVYGLTGHQVGFRLVTATALQFAEEDMSNANTFSFNIIPEKQLMQEYDESSDKRRERFSQIYEPSILDSPKLKHRFQISLQKIRSIKQFDVQVIISSNGAAYPVAVLGYYGSNINGWAGRVGLKRTQKPHTYPSTHYMPVESARDYLFFIPENVAKFTKFAPVN